MTEPFDFVDHQIAPAVCENDREEKMLPLIRARIYWGTALARLLWWARHQTHAGPVALPTLRFRL